MQQPNIVLITCHDLGRFLGCYGIPTVQTPHLDALAAAGVRFSRAFCTAPQCSPSRASLVTGRYPHSNGVMGLTHENFSWDLYPDERHLGQTLREAGYATALIGVHHETRSATPEQIATRCGMDVVAFGAHYGGPGEAVSARAVEQLAQFAAADRPFYLQVGFWEPHRMKMSVGPEQDDGYMGFIGDYLQPDTTLGVTVPPYLQPTERAAQEVAELQGAVQAADAAVGRLLDGLHDLGLADNTLVIFTTDHGVALPRSKCTLYEPGLETALIVRYPARGWRGGREIDALTSNVDLHPTLLDLLGLPPDPRGQGYSLLPLLDGTAQTPRTHIFGELTYHEYYDPRRSVRSERHKLILNFSPALALMDCSQSWRPRATPVTPPDPPTAYHPLVELFDLANDPYEQHNLAQDPAYRDVRRDLLATLSAWMRDTADPLLHGAVTPPLHRWALETLAGAEDTVVRYGHF